MNNAFVSTYRVRFGTGNVQLILGVNNKTGVHSLGLKPIENAFHPEPIDVNKTMGENGVVCFLEFSTIKSVDTVISALSNIRTSMAEKENVEDQNA